MSDYCDFQILTANSKPPKWAEKILGKGITYVANEMNDNLMFNVSVSELSLSDLIGSLRALEEKEPCKIFIKYGSYMGTYIGGCWLESLTHLPNLAAWQSYAIHLGKSTFIHYQMEHMKQLKEMES